MPILLRRGSRGCWVQLCSLDKSCTDPSSLAWCQWSSQGETQGRVCLRTWRLSEDIQPLGVNWCTSIYLYSRNITKDLFIFPSLKFLCLSKLHGWVPIVPARITQILEDRIAWRWRWKKLFYSQRDDWITSDLISAPACPFAVVGYSFCSKFVWGAFY